MTENQVVIMLLDHQEQLKQKLDVSEFQSFVSKVFSYLDYLVGAVKRLDDEREVTNFRITNIEETVGSMETKVEARFDSLEVKFAFLETKFDSLEKKVETKFNYLEEKIDSGFSEIKSMLS